MLRRVGPTTVLQQPYNGAKALLQLGRNLCHDIHQLTSGLGEKGGKGDATLL